jgi:hypothetical protein
LSLFLNKTSGKTTVFDKTSGIANLAGVAILLSYIIIISAFFSLIIQDQTSSQRGYVNLGSVINRSTMYDFVNNNYDSTLLGTTADPLVNDYKDEWKEFIGTGLISTRDNSYLFVFNVIPDYENTYDHTYYINNTILSKFIVYPEDIGFIHTQSGVAIDFTYNHIKIYQIPSLFQLITV